MTTTIKRLTACSLFIMISLVVLTGCGQTSASNASRRHSRQLTALVEQYSMGSQTLLHWVNQLHQLDPTFQRSSHWHATGPATVSAQLGSVRLRFRVVNQNQVVPATPATKNVWAILSSIFLVPSNDPLSASLGWNVTADNTTCPTVRVTAAGGTLPTGAIQVTVSVPPHSVDRHLEFILLNLLASKPRFLGAQTIVVPRHARTVSLMTNTQTNSFPNRPTGRPNRFNWVLPNMGVGWPYEAVVVDRSTDQLVGGTQFNLTYLPCTAFVPPKVPALPKGPPAETLPPVAAFRQALPDVVIPPAYNGTPWGVMFQGAAWWVVPTYHDQFISRGMSDGLALFDNHRLVWVLPEAWWNRETGGDGSIRVISVGARGSRLFVQFHADTAGGSGYFVHVVDLQYRLSDATPTLTVMAQYTR